MGSGVTPCSTLGRLVEQVWGREGSEGGNYHQSLCTQALSWTGFGDVGLGALVLRTWPGADEPGTSCSFPKACVGGGVLLEPS